MLYMLIESSCKLFGVDSRWGWKTYSGNIESSRIPDIYLDKKVIFSFLYVNIASARMEFQHNTFIGVIKLSMAHIFKISILSILWNF